MVFIQLHFILIAPAPLQNIRSNASFVKEYVFSVNVSWDQPEFTPESYNVVIAGVNEKDGDRRDAQSNRSFRGVSE